MRSKLIIKSSLLEEIADFKADEFLDRVGMSTHRSFAKASFKAGFRDCLIWLKEKGFDIGTVDDGRPEKDKP